MPLVGAISNLLLMPKNSKNPPMAQSNLRNFSNPTHNSFPGRAEGLFQVIDVSFLILTNTVFHYIAQNNLFLHSLMNKAMIIDMTHKQYIVMQGRHNHIEVTWFGKGKEMNS
jgi:hypothetical protein